MIESDRLILRRWHERDAGPFLAMGNDPRVMEYLGPPMSRADVDAAIARQNGFLDTHGHCFWALERRDDGAFLGFCGIKPGAADTPVEGKAEIGWRLGAEHWGKGYAREAAEACLDHGWTALGFDRVWAITTIGNSRSWGLMERLGMTRHPELDFRHPLPGLEERLRPHITYSIGKTL
ncbi:GNAT family N-acetyltransferase [Rhizorhabdus dicambivorans]|uniref:N-acetyltransferase n=1 Tax=Rhizorhabdus dicambivorans TaxID=1850238 RepID=A0A2A4FW01_9SPHN|nr:GNAT family N-acetyltransferase [Rhizorhabdus dicambivorans]ATE65523.1 N-acetyltransferase [Rhizorhabdus dicambivorans]PCE41866.1 N-acetyltransferase [Rhizorhabdus dicambivorans]